MYTPVLFQAWITFILYIRIYAQVLSLVYLSNAGVGGLALHPRLLALVFLDEDLRADLVLPAVLRHLV